MGGQRKLEGLSKEFKRSLVPVLRGVDFHGLATKAECEEMLRDVAEGQGFKVMTGLPTQEFIDAICNQSENPPSTYQPSQTADVSRLANWRHALHGTTKPTSEKGQAREHNGQKFCRILINNEIGQPQYLAHKIDTKGRMHQYPMCPVENMYITFGNIHATEGHLSRDKLFDIVRNQDISKDICNKWVKICCPKGENNNGRPAASLPVPQAVLPPAPRPAPQVVLSDAPRPASSVQSRKRKAAPEADAPRPAPYVPVPFVAAPVNADLFVAAPFVAAPFVAAPFVAAPFDPAPFDPAPFDPAPFDPAPLAPAPFDPVLVDPALLDPAPLDAAPFDMAPFDAARFVAAPFVAAPFDAAALDLDAFDMGTFDMGAFDMADTAPFDEAAFDEAPLAPALLAPAPLVPAPFEYITPPITTDPSPDGPQPQELPNSALFLDDPYVDAPFDLELAQGLAPVKAR